MILDENVAVAIQGKDSLLSAFYNLILIAIKVIFDARVHQVSRDFK
jgi:hypothetical protein